MKKLLTFFSCCLLPITVSFALEPSDLTLDEKIGQLLTVHFSGKQANKDAQLLMEKAHVGGFIYYEWSNSLESFAQVRTLSQSLKAANAKYSSIPLFLATDQEGGRVSRLKKDFPQFPSNRILGQIGIPELVYETAKAQAKELKAAGLNVNYAPVVDVDNNPRNPIIGDRSYGADPQSVTLYAREALRGYKDVGIMSVIKHFPGHGDVEIDTHHATPLVNKSLEELYKMELLPFYNLKGEAEAMMTAHIFFPSIDPNKPASVSEQILQKLLRESWDYEGLVISDSLIMKGLIRSEGSIEAAALSALQAGSDILCLGGKLLNESSQEELTPQEVLRIHTFLVRAVKSGQLSEKAVDKSVERILKAKDKYAVEATDPLSKEEKEYHSLLERECALLSKITLTDKSTCERIAKKIWHNETGSSLDKLLYWNPDEDFLSLGIGHFIWYPEKRYTTYKEGFPSYLSFLKSQQAPLPTWLASATSCPWSSRAEFLSGQKSIEKKELLEWLASTMDLQGKFLLHQLPVSLHEIFSSPITLEQKQKIMGIVEKLSSTPEGLYALVDYLNFKGLGLHELERYKGEGWGLIQVLTYLSEHHSADFSSAARHVLERRVKNAPDPEKEKKWLKGWLSRVNTYK